MTEAIRRHRRWTTLSLALPLFAGGWLAVLFGAWDYLPWLTSPAVIGGLSVTVIAGVLLKQRGVVQWGQVAQAVLLGGAGFGLSLLLFFVAVLVIWFRPGGATVQ